MCIDNCFLLVTKPPSCSQTYEGPWSVIKSLIHQVFFSCSNLSSVLMTNLFKLIFIWILGSMNSTRFIWNVMFHDRRLDDGLDVIKRRTQKITRWTTNVTQIEIKNFQLGSRQKDSNESNLTHLKISLFAHAESIICEHTWNAYELILFLKDFN